jgi:rhodanese-related sulfurtransferase
MSADDKDRNFAGVRHLFGSRLVLAMAVAVVAVPIYFAIGMPGMDHGSGSSMSGMDMPAGAHHQIVDAEAFAKAIEQPDAILINVHQPYEGEIAGTDQFAQYDSVDPVLLPHDRSTPILVYCMTGSMSAVAAKQILSLGYTNVTELRGGMQAWRASGRDLVQRSGA